jgi:hypothetical protein
MRPFPLLALAAPFLLISCSLVSAQPVAGGYAAIDPASDVALQARANIQGYFSLSQMRLEDILQAATQVVAGTNVKLRCKVTGDVEPAVWEFVIWHKLDGSWRLTAATKVEPLIWLRKISSVSTPPGPPQAAR